MKLPPIDIIIPTFDNAEYLYPCVRSLLMNRHCWPIHLYVVNNGHPQSVNLDHPQVTVLQPGRNLGWEGGLQAGLAVSTAPYVVFCNDDILVPRASTAWARTMMEAFRDPIVAAVGPASNVVMGTQNIFLQAPSSFTYVPYLIGFFLLIERAALDAVGGVDATLPGGDDLDLSLRLRQSGRSLVAKLDVFIYHHGFKTGERVYGGADRPGGWNSAAMTERTDNVLIRKHGFATWNALWPGPETMNAIVDHRAAIEQRAVADWVTGERILEFGCGDKKTVPQAVGVDWFKAGETTDHLQTSVAEVVADVFAPMPQFADGEADVIIARHILEHAVDPVAVLREWHRILKPVGGRLIVAMPNDDIQPGVPMDHEHKHGWTPDSFRSLAEVCGYRHVASTPDCGNHVAFVSIVERP